MESPESRSTRDYPEYRTGWGKLRFLRPDVEAAYRAWRFERAIPFNRVAMWASLLSWVATLLTYLLVRGEALWVAQVGGMALPFVALSLAATYYRPAWRWVDALLMAANTSAGFTVAAVLNPQLPAELQTGSIMLVMFYALAIQRISPLRSCLSVAPFLVFESWVLFSQELNGAAHVGRFGSVLLVIGFTTGFMVASVLDQASRDAFRQERIIEAQRESLARERERTEALHEQELRYQVAERSRSLGDALARAEELNEVRQLEAGDRFDARYAIVNLVGSGAMGQVYEVERLTDQQRLALKVMSVSGSQAKRFAREAEIGARIVHENVVPIVDVGVGPQGSPYLVMELIKGGTLEAQRSRFGDAAWALGILEQVAAGLSALHEHGVIHRDLKPANILLSDDPATPSVKISDFGLARYNLATDDSANPHAHTIERSKSAQAALTATGVFLGTPLYMAPEAAQGARNTSARSDLFAFGVIAYELLSGKNPFAVPPVVHAMTGQAVPLPAPLTRTDVNPAIASMILGCLATAPEERPELKSVLELLRSRPHSTRPEPSSRRRLG